MGTIITLANKNPLAYEALLKIDYNTIYNTLLYNKIETEVFEKYNQLLREDAR